MKNKLTLLEKITLTAAGLVIAYYFVYFMLCVIAVEALKMALFALFVMACVSLPILLRKSLKRLLGRAFKPLHIIFMVLLCLYVISVIVFWAFIGLNSSKTPEYYAEKYAAEENTGADTVVLVFGAYTNGMTPTKTLQNRLDAAYELLVALPDAVCVVSGSKGVNESVAECVAMRGYLIDRGISEKRIIMEGDARSTSENVRFTKALLADLGLSDKHVIGVSTSFHIPRIEILSKRYDLPMDTCSAPAASAANYFANMTREYLSYIKMMFVDKAVFINLIGG